VSKKKKGKKGWFFETLSTLMRDRGQERKERGGRCARKGSIHTNQERGRHSSRYIV